MESRLRAEFIEKRGSFLPSLWEGKGAGPAGGNVDVSGLCFYDGVKSKGRGSDPKSRYVFSAFAGLGKSSCVSRWRFPSALSPRMHGQVPPGQLFLTNESMFATNQYLRALELLAAVCAADL